MAHLPPEDEAHTAAVGNPAGPETTDRSANPRQRPDRGQRPGPQEAAGARIPASPNADGETH